METPKLKKKNIYIYICVGESKQKNGNDVLLGKKWNKISKKMPSNRIGILKNVSQDWGSSLVWGWQIVTLFHFSTQNGRATTFLRNNKHMMRWKTEITSWTWKIMIFTTKSREEKKKQLDDQKITDGNVGESNYLFNLEVTSQCA